MILSAIFGSAGSMVGNGAPAMWPERASPFSESFTWLAYFSVASLYAFGHAMGLGAMTFIDMPWFTHHSTAGEISSFALATFDLSTVSPGDTSAAATTAIPSVAAITLTRSTLIMGTPPRWLHPHGPGALAALSREGPDRSQRKSPVRARVSTARIPW